MALLSRKEAARFLFAKGFDLNKSGDGLAKAYKVAMKDWWILIATILKCRDAEEEAAAKKRRKRNLPQREQEELEDIRQRTIRFCERTLAKREAK